MSLPREVQERLVRALPGLDQAQMLRPGTRWNTISFSPPS
jgi:tRNA U34 5-carboxymethylaminomethyl modifying enzyme MnmG/GidA